MNFLDIKINNTNLKKKKTLAQIHLTHLGLLNSSAIALCGVSAIIYKSDSNEILCLSNLKHSHNFVRNCKKR